MSSPSFGSGDHGSTRWTDELTAIPAVSRSIIASWDLPQKGARYV